MIHPMQSSLDAFVEKFRNQAKVQADFLSIEFDPQWPSPCYQKEGVNGDIVPWIPVKQAPRGSFKGTEEALALTLHPDFHCFFTSYYSFHLPAIAPQGRCELLQVCSDADFDRLQQNIIGHLLMKKRLKQSPTLFIGLTEDDDYLISLDNTSGEVVLERVGKEPEQVLATNLSTFLDSLSLDLNEQ
ncbi:SecY-interacting protein [Alteromonas sp. C1M14]|uniref:SecY-interacting protein n=1 Tax=Alteromonas sp. C1M14 TaxID=2841567 RepID=UPI001C09263B|nr:SecY-interacting protein [Alteromonas sp. C1M14]MBU2977844.1 SecY-interacting protein [Alteromonas sp. C1M14]